MSTPPIPALDELLERHPTPWVVNVDERYRSLHVRDANKREVGTWDYYNVVFIQAIIALVNAAAEKCNE